MLVLPLVLGSALATPAALPSTPAPSSVALATAAVLQDEAAPEDLGVWRGGLDVGLTKSEGNANNSSYAITGSAVREMGTHRYTADALWYYATQDDLRIQRRALGSLKYDKFVSEKTYLYGNVLAETNEQAAVDLRWTVGAGIGEQWRDDDQWRISTEIGAGWFDERYDGADDTEYLVVRGAWEVTAAISETLTFGSTGEIFPSLDDKDDIYGLATTDFSAVLSESMVAKLQWILTYDNTPVAGNVRTDNIYLLTVGWKF
jgi:putative salt-induced outer membrane protein YdiY